MTPRGWESGSEKLDMSSNIVAPPSDRVLTHCAHSHMSSGFSATNNWCDETTYADHDEIARLKKRHGPCPDCHGVPASTKRGS